MLNLNPKQLLNSIKDPTDEKSLVVSTAIGNAVTGNTPYEEYIVRIYQNQYDDPSLPYWYPVLMTTFTDTIGDVTMTSVSETAYEGIELSSPGGNLDDLKMFAFNSFDFPMTFFALEFDWERATDYVLPIATYGNSYPYNPWGAQTPASYILELRRYLISQ